MKIRILLISGLLLFTLIAKSQINLEEGLVAFYPFNENAIDESSNDNDGLVFGATLTEDRFGNKDSAYFFDGNDYINVGNSETISFPNTSPFTFSIWFMPDSIGGRQDLFTKNNRNISAQYFAFQGDDKVALYRRTFEEPRYFSSSASIQEDIWHHYLVVYDGSTATLYLNGIPTGQRANWGSINDINTDVLIGASFDENIPGIFYHGTIDDIRIYNRAVNTEEVIALSNEQITSVNDGINKLNISINPIPAINTVTIQHPHNTLTQIHLLDLNGRHLMTTQSTTGETQFDLSALPEGIYLVHLVNEKYNAVRKVLKSGR